MQAGARLGPYAILEPLGKGGMGEVWLAQDPRLGRRVAVKVLPDEFAGDPERLARFEQEARAAAALNHPHIAAVYDVGTEGSTHYMVQELLEGESLRELLERRGALPLDMGLRLATEIAQALRAAHSAGIVHRDLKPENVFVTEDDHAKVLDFGLAKLTETGPVGPSATMSPTQLGTVAGVIMGTAGYMAPEQVKGEEVDARADLFAFGCVLYEMVTGERAFAGDNVHETLSRILSRDPVPVIERRGDLPATVGWIVDKALAKDPARRYQTAADAAVDLVRLQEQVAAGTAGRTEVGGDGPAAAGLPASVAALAGLVLVAASVAATWWLSRPEPPAPAPVQRFDFSIAPADAFTNINNSPVAIARDGRTILVVASEDRSANLGHLWSRSIDGLDVVRIRNTVEPRSPAFSPDGEEIAFWSDPDEIVRIPAAGGGPVTVAPLADRPYGISWGTDGNLWVGRGHEGIWRVPATGGDLRQVVAVAEGESAYGPRLLEDGERVLFTLRREGASWNEAEIVFWSPHEPELRVVLQGGRDARITPSGHLVYVRDNVLMARPIDTDTLEITGGAVAMVDPVPTSGGDLMGAAFYDVSDSGTLVWTTGGTFVREVSLAWADPEGSTAQRLPMATGPYNDWRLSPDGERVAVERLGIQSEIWIYDVDRPAGQRLGETEGSAASPVWSHDGEWVYFQANPHVGRLEIRRRRADFGGQQEVVVGADERDWTWLKPTDTSRDGEWLLYVAYVEGVEGEIVRHALRGGEPEQETILTAPNLEDARLSPDGRLIAYSTLGGNAWEVYVYEIASGARALVSVGGGRHPAWSPDGTEIYYWNASEFAARVHTEPRLRVDNPEVLNPMSLGYSAIQEPAPDGQRMLVGVFEAAGSDSFGNRVFVTLNWFEELRQRVAPRGR